jgi:hypothetical protein
LTVLKTPKPEPAPPPARTEEAPRERFPWTKQVLLGSALALIGEVIGRAVGVIPNPFGHGSSTPSGSIRIGDTSPNEPLAALRHPGAQAETGDRLGVILTVERSSQNTSGECRIVWTFVDATGPKALGEPKTARDMEDDPGACNGATRIWVPFSPSLFSDEEVFVRVELFDGRTRLGLPAESDHIKMG